MLSSDFICTKNKMIWWSYFLKSKYNILLNKLGKIDWVKHTYKGKQLLDNDEFNKQVYNWIIEGEPKCICRFGSNEAYTTAEAIGVMLGLKKHIREKCLISINRNAGVFPYGEDTAYKFGIYMAEFAGKIDLLGCWRTIMQDYLINEICDKDMRITRLMNLEPYYSDSPWSAALEGKKVLVIHPFKNTIEKQYAKRNLIFENKNVLPEFELTVLKAVQTMGYEQDARFNDWFEAIDYMFNEAMKINFDVAIIGCGAYGLPLAARIKEAGKIAIHLGGATQLLFGIKGKRWDGVGFGDKYYNEYWVRPEESEKPQNAVLIENGCYW